jgi:hypothetical protein
MKNLPTFDTFLNEERVYGMFNDNQGKPSKISQEILDWVISYYYNQYYYKLLPILQQKQKKNIASKRSNKHF